MRRATLSLMKTPTKIVIAGVVAVALAAGGATAVAAGSSSGDSQAPIRGADLERASTAALASTGEGKVTGTEVGDEDSYYEVEVTLDDGSQVDVQLDRDFAVVSSAADVESPDSDD